MSKTILVSVLAVLAAAANGCAGSTCDQLSDASVTCGGTLNLASCEADLPSCTATDKGILDDYADCVNQPSVCNNGRVVDANAQAACENAASGLSTACADALGGK